MREGGIRDERREEGWIVEGIMDHLSSSPHLSLIASTDYKQTKVSAKIQQLLNTLKVYFSIHLHLYFFSIFLPFSVLHVFFFFSFFLFFLLSIHSLFFLLQHIIPLWSL